MGCSHSSRHGSHFSNSNASRSSSLRSSMKSTRGSTLDISHQILGAKVIFGLSEKKERLKKDSTAFSFTKIILRFGTIGKVLEQLKVVFNSFDTEGTGTITRQSFKEAMNHVHSAMTEEELDELFDVCNMDGNHDLSMREFICMLAVARLIQAIPDISGGLGESRRGKGPTLGGTSSVRLLADREGPSMSREDGSPTLGLSPPAVVVPLESSSSVPVSDEAPPPPTPPPSAQPSMERIPSSNSQGEIATDGGDGGGGVGLQRYMSHGSSGNVRRKNSTEMLFRSASGEFPSFMPKTPSQEQLPPQPQTPTPQSSEPSSQQAGEKEEEGEIVQGEAPLPAAAAAATSSSSSLPTTAEEGSTSASVVPIATAAAVPQPAIAEEKDDEEEDEERETDGKRGGGGASSGSGAMMSSRSSLPVTLNRPVGSARRASGTAIPMTAISEDRTRDPSSVNIFLSTTSKEVEAALRNGEGVKKGSMPSHPSFAERVKWKKIPSMVRATSDHNFVAHTEAEEKMYKSRKEVAYVMDLIIAAYLQFDEEPKGYIDRKDLSRHLSTSAGNKEIGFLEKERWEALAWDSSGRLSFEEFVFTFSHWIDIEDGDEDGDDYDDFEEVESKAVPVAQERSDTHTAEPQSSEFFVSHRESDDGGRGGGSGNGQAMEEEPVGLEVF